MHDSENPRHTSGESSSSPAKREPKYAEEEADDEELSRTMNEVE